jgi:hypothetical protein
MLTIRKEQFALFERSEITKFEEPTYLRLNELFPEKCQDLGETRLRKMIHYGIQRSSSYGITAADHVRTYIDVMMLLGPDFDKDPKYPWAEKTLGDKDYSKDPKIRVARVHEEAVKLHSEKV